MKDLKTPRNRDMSKQEVAFSSVCAAVFLTASKLIIGVMTGSLGLLSEAAHSGLDLIAALVTFFAVRVSDAPADEDHTYGHGKVENLSALVETLLLLATCVWIIKEAVARLLFREVSVEVTTWSFLVILVSIGVDITRSRALMRVAKAQNSQALEADAIHFSTDVWSSCVVLVGLAAVKIGEWLGNSRIWEKADALAALGVALIVIRVSVNLGRRTVEALLDKAPIGMIDKLFDVIRQTDGVLKCERVRVRQSGAQTFADVVIGVKGNLSLERSHEICTDVEDHIQGVAPRMDVILHVEPVYEGDGDLSEKIHAIAAARGIKVHNLIGYKEDGKLFVEMHMESDENRLLESAHAEAGELKAEILKKTPDISDLVIHIEPRKLNVPTLETTDAESEELIGKVRTLVTQRKEIRGCHKISLRKQGKRMFLSFHCMLDPHVTLREAEEITGDLEKRIRDVLPALERVTIHSEPYGS
jgi:cation diffusion facilitator family transporter